MGWEGVNVGFGFTGSFCTYEKVMPAMEELIREKANVIPVFSDATATMDTRFGKAKDWKARVEELTGKEIIRTIVDAEPIGPKGLVDLMIIAPCSGNSMAKLANGITDDPVLMAAKAHLRNDRPVLLGIATNDGLGNNAKNLAYLLNAQNIFLVPFGQDDPYRKVNSLVSHMDLILPAGECTLQGEQMQPVIQSYNQD